MRYQISEKYNISVEDRHPLRLRAKIRLSHLPLNPLYRCTSSSKMKTLRIFPFAQQNSYLYCDAILFFSLKSLKFK